MNKLKALMETMVKINNDLRDEVEYISTTDDCTTGRFTRNDLETIYNGAEALKFCVTDYDDKAICEAVKVRSAFVYLKTHE